jgi:hypothetical protein
VLGAADSIQHFYAGTGYRGEAPSIAIEPVLHPLTTWDSGAIEKKLTMGSEEFRIIIELWSPVRLFEYERVLGDGIGLL